MSLRSPLRSLRPLSTVRPFTASARSLKDKPWDHTSRTDTQSDVHTDAKDTAASPPSGPQALDSATASKGGKSAGGETTEGNPAGVGMVDQVGGEGKAGESSIGGTEEAQAPGLFQSVKQGLGIGTKNEDVKQNRDAGYGVTGTGSKQ